MLYSTHGGKKGNKKLLEAIGYDGRELNLSSGRIDFFLIFSLINIRKYSYDYEFLS